VNYKRILKNSVLAGIVVFCAFLPGFLYASSNIVKVDQAKIRIIAPAGQTAIGRIEVKNPSDEVKNIKVYAEDWLYSNERGEKEFFLAGTKELSCAKWISFVPAEFSISPGGKEYIQYTVRIPQDVSGSYRAILFFESMMGVVQESTEAMAIVPVAVRVGTLVSVEVEGTVLRSAQVENLKMIKTQDGYNIEADFTNTANADITVAGNFDVVDKKGMVFSRGEFKNRYTLPGDKVKIASAWKGLLPKGSYDLVITLDLGISLEELGVGRGPTKVMETEVEADENGNIVNVGELR
jgi:hypothetical protein